jgi:hypothetical protein
VSTPEENKVEHSAQAITNQEPKKHGYWPKQKGLKHPERRVKRPRYAKELKGLVGQVNVTCAVSKSLVQLLEEQCLLDGVTRSDILRAALIREVAFRKFCRDNGTSPLTASHLTPSLTKQEKAQAKQAKVKVKVVKPTMVSVPKETLDQISFVFKALNG